VSASLTCADDVSDLLWTSDLDPTDRLGYFAKFCPPTVANGRVYIGTAFDTAAGTGALRVYGSIHRPVAAPAAGVIYELVNHATSWAADVGNASTAAGTAVIQWPLDGGANQHWELQTSGAAFKLLAANSGMVLDVMGTVQAGNPVDQAAANGGTSQQWVVEPAATSGYYVITSSGEDVVLTSPSANQGDTLIVDMPKGTRSQEWQLVPVP
jgi:hypothetical protein